MISLEFQGFDSSTFFMLRGGIPRSVGNFKVRLTYLVVCGFLVCGLIVSVTRLSAAHPRARSPRRVSCSAPHTLADFDFRHHRPAVRANRHRLPRALRRYIHRIFNASKLFSASQPVVRTHVVVSSAKRSYRMRTSTRPGEFHPSERREGPARAEPPNCRIPSRANSACTLRGSPEPDEVQLLAAPEHGANARSAESGERSLDKKWALAWDLEIASKVRTQGWNENQTDWSASSGRRLSWRAQKGKTE